MIEFFIDAISKGLAFSKAEAKGTFVLIIIVLFSITSFRLLSNKIKTSDTTTYDPTELAVWVKDVESSYSEKKQFKKLTETSTPKSYKDEATFPSSKREENPSMVDDLKLPVLDLNAASAEDLQKVRGIGKIYSERIVKYRAMLGGFVSTEQLREVYGLSDEVRAKIKERFSIQSKVESIEINSDSVKLLAKHPYISYDLAWVIINYRKQNGDIRDFDDLKGIKALNDSVLLKLKPYLE